MVNDSQVVEDPVHSLLRHAAGWEEASSSEGKKIYVKVRTRHLEHDWLQPTSQSTSEAVPETQDLPVCQRQNFMACRRCGLVPKSGAWVGCTGTGAAST